MSAQLAFDLPPRDGWSREDFFASPANVEALRAVEGWRNWPGQRMLLLGPSGSGKTHLAHIWAELAGAIWVTPEILSDRLADIPAEARVIVDGAQNVAGQTETALFHLYNRLTPQGYLMLTAPTPPRDWGLGLPDVLSRLQAMAIARLEPPDDALLAAVLVKLLADRQVSAPANLIPYLLPRIERSIAAARALVAALDAQSLASQRPITRALAAEVLDLGPPE